MSAFGGMIFTNRGKALQAKAQTGVPLVFTRIAVGDGNLGGQAIQELNGLIHQVKSINITQLKTMAGGKAKAGGVLSNQDIVTGFYWRELGLFATDPDVGEIMYCYGNAGALAEYIPSPNGPDLLEKYINIITIVGNASNVSAVIDSSLVYATIQDLETKADKTTFQSHLIEIEPHGKYSNNNEMIYTNGKLTHVDEKIDGVLRKKTSLTYTGDELTNVNVKVYAANGTTVISEYNEVFTYTSGNLTNVQRMVVV